MVHVKRFLCLFLALVLLLTWPGFLPQKAQADAVADDAALMSLALLFTTWSGITFQQSDQAVTAMRNFISTKTSAAASLAGLITKGLVTEAGKLLITGDVRTAFRDVVTDIKDFFVTPSDSFEGSLVGSVPLGVSLPFDSSYSMDFLASNSAGLFAPTSNSVTVLRSNGDVYTLSANSYGLNFSDSSGYGFGASRKYFSNVSDVIISSFYFTSSLKDSVSYFTVVVVYSTSSKSSKYYGRTFEHIFPIFPLDEYVSSAAVSSDSNSVSFKQSQTVNGSSVSSTLDSTDLDAAGASISMAPVTGVISSGVAGSTAAPGLSAEDYERILADALAGTAVIPTTPEPTTAEPTETTPEEDKEHILTPDIFNTGLSGLKESFSDWWSGVKTWFELKIQAFQDWLSAFWASLIAAVTVTIPDFLSGISDSISTFFTVTFPAWGN